MTPDPTDLEAQIVAAIRGAIADLRGVDPRPEVPARNAARAVTYFLHNARTQQVKIGRSSLPGLPGRVAALEHASGCRLTVLRTLPGQHEPRWHRRFAQVRTVGEWFTATPALLAAIRSIPDPYA